MKVRSILAATLLASAFGCTTDKTDVDQEKNDAAEDTLKAEHKAEEKVAKAEDKAEEQTQKAVDKAEETAQNGQAKVQETAEKAQAKAAKAEDVGTQKVAKEARKAFADRLESELKTHRAELKDVEKASKGRHAGSLSAELRTAIADERTAANEVRKLKRAPADTWETQRQEAERALAKLDQSVARAKSQL